MCNKTIIICTMLCPVNYTEQNYPDRDLDSNLDQEILSCY